MQTATKISPIIESKIGLQTLELNVELIYLYSRELFTKYPELEPLMNNIKKNTNAIKESQDSIKIYEFYINCDFLLYYMVFCLLQKCEIKIPEASLITYIKKLQKNSKINSDLIKFLHILRVLLKSKIGEPKKFLSKNDLQENILQENDLQEIHDFSLEIEIFDMTKTSIILRCIIEHIYAFFESFNNDNKEIMGKVYRCQICKKSFKDINLRNEHILIQSHHKIVKKCHKILKHELIFIISLISNIELLKNIDELVDLSIWLQERTEKFILSEFKLKLKNRYGIGLVSFITELILERMIGNLCHRYEIFVKKNKQIVTYLEELKKKITISHDIIFFEILNRIVNQKMHYNLNNYDDICIDNDVVHVEEMMRYLILVLYGTILLCQ